MSLIVIAIYYEWNDFIEKQKIKEKKIKNKSQLIINDVYDFNIFEFSVSRQMFWY